MNECILDYITIPEIKEAISKIGRTEDVKFSPDNKRFAITDLYENKIHLFSVEFDNSSTDLQIQITDYIQLSSKYFKHPHGLCFLDNDHIVVCNRKGGLSIVKIPPEDFEPKEYDVVPLVQLSGKGYLFTKVKSPGSVDAYKISDNSYRVLVCNNYWHIITSHIISIDNAINISNEGVLIEDSLKIPDGISISPNNKWIAITNHISGNVLIYENTQNLNRNTPPTKILEGPVCPHGIRFSLDGKKLLVADASAPYLHIFESESSNWNNINIDCRSIKMLEDEMFYKGRYGSREGGLKGIDLNHSNSLLITTHKDQIIGFYDLSKINEKKDEIDLAQIKELCLQRDESLNNKRDFEIINRRGWRFTTRLFYSMRSKIPRFSLIKKRLRDMQDLLYLIYKNKFSDNLITDSAGPIVSLTTHGFRLKTVFLAIESIARGSKKPSRIILWLNHENDLLKPPESLVRLMKRGLELKYSENYGPHTKYYPYIVKELNSQKPLITADDDNLYPKYWLQKLIEVYEANPSAIHCYRAHKIGLKAMKFLPYIEWPNCSDKTPSHTNFITGVSGVIYPEPFLQYLRERGQEFMLFCNKNDDVWLTLSALRSGFKVAQVMNKSLNLKKIPGSQKQRLMDYNVALGGTQLQLIDSFSEEDIVKLDSYINSEKEEATVDCS